MVIYSLLHARYVRSEMTLPQSQKEKKRIRISSCSLELLFSRYLNSLSVCVPVLCCIREWKSWRVHSINAMNGSI